VIAAAKENPYQASYALAALQRAGRTEEMTRFIAEMLPRTNAHFAFNAHLALGQYEQAFTPDAYKTLGEPQRFLFEPFYDPVRNDPRWLKMMGDVGLTQAHGRAQAWRATHPPEKPEGTK
jgi:hypothetical protein